MKMEESLPPGFRFHPTDEELITCYLTRKVSDISFTSKAVVDVDLNKCEPWDLPGTSCFIIIAIYFLACLESSHLSLKLFLLLNFASCSPLMVKVFAL